MVRIDSSKIAAPIDSIKSWDKGNYFRQPLYSGDAQLLSDKSYINNPSLGLKRIEINHTTSQLIVETSGKILKENYYEGINQNTIEQLVDAINNTNLIDIDKSLFIGEGQFLRADFTDNIKVEHNPREYIEALSAINYNPKYRVSTYREKRNKGVVFQGTQKSFKERFIAYYKLLDVLQDKELIKEVGYTKLVNDFEGVVRLEQNKAQLRKIREACSILDTSIMNVLTSEQKPNYKLLHKIKANVQLDLFDDYEHLKMYELEKKFGRRHIIKQLNYDMELIKQLVSNKVKGNTSNYIKHYKQEMYEMQSESLVKTMTPTNLLIEELSNKLMAEAC